VDATALIRSMVQVQHGRPAPGMGTLPVAWLDAPLLQRALRRVCREPADWLGYGQPAGDESLRLAVSRRLADLGVPAAPAQIVTTVGATHALDIVSRTLLRPGDPVMVEEPGWAVEFARLSALGMHSLPVPRRAATELMQRLGEEVERRLTRHLPVAATLHRSNDRRGSGTAGCIDEPTDELPRPPSMLRVGVAELQLVLHPAGPGADGGQAEAVGGEQPVEPDPRDVHGRLGEHLHRIEPQFGRRAASGLEAIVEDEGPLAGFRHEADRDRGLHASTG
jgi:hypothetical protein